MGLRPRKRKKRPATKPFRCGHLCIDRVTKRCTTCGKRVATLKAWLKPPKPPKPKLITIQRLGVKQCRSKVVENGHKLRCLEIWKLVRFRGNRRLATLCMGCHRPQKGPFAKLANRL